MELARQALELLLYNKALHGWYGNQLEEVLGFSLRKVDRAYLRVNFPPQYLLQTDPVTLPHLELLCAYRLLCFARQVQREPIEGSGDAIEDLTFLFGPTLHRCYHIIHITVYVGEATQGVGQTRPCLGGLGDSNIPWYWKHSMNEGVCHIRHRLQ